MAGFMLFGMLAMLVVGVLLCALVVHLAAKFSGVPDARFGKAVKAVLINALASFLLSLVFSVIPLAGTVLGLLVSLWVTLLVLRRVYEVGWGQSLLLWVMQWVVLGLLLVGMAFFMGVSVFALGA